MNQFSKILLLFTIAILLVWQLPWCYAFLTTKAGPNRFVMYSSLLDDFIVTEYDKDKESIHSLTAILTYSGAPFGVPANLFILGTMNTTDRSTGTLDYALRRRFVFKTMKADEQIVNAQEKEIADIAMPLFRQVKEFIIKYNSGDMDIEDLMIGHSYFLASNEEQLRNNIEYKIKPLIKEYINDGILRMPSAKTLDDIFASWSNFEKKENEG